MTSSTPRDVAAIVVSYNTLDLLLKCLQSLCAAQADEPLTEIVVVDNSSTDSSAEATSRHFPEVHVEEAPNRGFGAAVNRGAALAESEYLLILNADTEVRPGAITELRRAMDVHPRVGLVGPQLLYPDGSIQPSRRRFPTPLSPFFESTIVEEWWPDNPWARAYHMRDAPERSPQPVDWLVGAALLVRRAAFEQVHGFDPAFRMYSEEVDLAYRMRRYGWRALYVGTAQVVHHEGASTAQDVPRRQAEFDTSRVRLQRRMHGRLAAYGLALALRVGYGLHLARESAKWLVGHKRDLRAARIRLYSSLLINGWAKNG